MTDLSMRNETVSGSHMFELFRSYEGEEYTVYVREDGKRFYVDFEEQVWNPLNYNVIDLYELITDGYFAEMAILS